MTLAHLFGFDQIAETDGFPLTVRPRHRLLDSLAYGGSNRGGGACIHAGWTAVSGRCASPIHYRPKPTHSCNMSMHSAGYSLHKSSIMNERSPHRESCVVLLFCIVQLLCLPLQSIVQLQTDHDTLKGHNGSARTSCLNLSAVSTRSCTSSSLFFTSSSRERGGAENTEDAADTGGAA